ncbi:MAG: amino acid permease [Alphaproteobacteria bacterium]|nr:MAG: amino acid permease [Alphaproteobacteria bacterium]
MSNRSDTNAKPSAKPRVLGPIELIAMGVGGMIGGGIFSVLGLAVQISGHGAWLAFSVGALVALAAGYSYLKLALAFPTDGASFTYVERGWPDHPFFAMLTGWTVIVGYVGTLALYAFTFGAYGADLLGKAGEGRLVPDLLSAAVLLFFLIVNLRGPRTSGITEDLVVYAKILLLAVFAVAGFVNMDKANLMPLFDRGVPNVFVAGAMVFVAYEGFQLINSAVEETRNPRRNVPIGIYGSIIIVSVIYIALALVSLGTLGEAGLIAHREYALAEAARPVLGEAGTVLVAIAALLATSSAINATVFGAARLMAQMGEEGKMPAILARRNAASVPAIAVWLLVAAALALTLLGGLEIITAFSSMTFLLVSITVTLANLKLRRVSGAKVLPCLAGLVLMSVTVALVVLHLANERADLLLAILSFYATVAGASFAYLRAARASRRA